MSNYYRCDSRVHTEECRYAKHGMRWYFAEGMPPSELARFVQYKCPWLKLCKTCQPGIEDRQPEVSA